MTVALCLVSRVAQSKPTVRGCMSGCPQTDTVWKLSNNNFPKGFNKVCNYCLVVCTWTIDAFYTFSENGSSSALLPQGLTLHFTNAFHFL